MAGNHNSGRKPKPTRLTELLGNPGGRPLNHREPQFDTAGVAPSKHLDEDARQVWTEYAQLLSSRGLLTVADVLKFELLCTASGRLRQVGRLLPVGITSETNPKILAAEVRYMLLLDKFASAFGMDPASRVRLKTPEPQKGHWLDALTGDEEPSGPGDPVH
jgi:P27 family predicted phage terminase small subunit